MSARSWIEQGLIPAEIGTLVFGFVPKDLTPNPGMNLSLGKSVLDRSSKVGTKVRRSDRLHFPID